MERHSDEADQAPWTNSGVRSSARPVHAACRHNHPSGDPAPSQLDIRLTRDLVDAGSHMRIAVHDHVIVGTQGRSSMKALGLI